MAEVYTYDKQLHKTLSLSEGRQGTNVRDFYEFNDPVPGTEMGSSTLQVEQTKDKQVMRETREEIRLQIEKEIRPQIEEEVRLRIEKEMKQEKEKTDRKKKKKTGLKKDQNERVKKQKKLVLDRGRIRKR